MKKLLFATAGLAALAGIATAFIIFVALCTGTVTVTESVGGEKYTITTEGWCYGFEPDIDIEIFFYMNSYFIGTIPVMGGVGEHEIDWVDGATRALVTVQADCNGALHIEGHVFYCTRHAYDEVSIYK